MPLPVSFSVFFFGFVGVYGGGGVLLKTSHPIVAKVSVLLDV